ncbi:hypothetical protein K2X89_13060 [Myxococcota bacterium]|nr:hypothetical protein [Myxococcota bacterium]
MPIEQHLLDILICPESGQPLVRAEPDLLAKLNLEIKGRRLRNRAGELVKDEIQEGLVRKDGRFLYVIDDDIAVMMIEKSIEIA